MKFYKCDDCEDLILHLFNYNEDATDCSEGRMEMKVGTIDASLEKHVPFVEREGDILKVSIGEVEHPMVDDHWIDFIIAEREDGFELKRLKPGDKPYAEFNAEGVIAIYEFCNLHGVWKTEL